MESSWQPILEGPLVKHIRDTVVAIARALALGEGERCKRTDAALFWAYLAGEYDDAWVQEAYDTAVVALADEIQGGFGDDISLFHGAAGAGFVIAHISEPELVADSLLAIDEAIDDHLAALAMPVRDRSYDLIDGLVGVGVYLLERVDHSASARQALARIVDHLAALSEPAGSDLAWHTPAAQLVEDQRTAYPNGYFNCGLAHGMPGIVSMLARVATQDIIEDRVAARARELATGGHHWLSARRLPTNKRSCFPGWVDRARGGSTTRTAWCYGDPGAATALWDAGCRLGLSVDGAIEVAREAATRAPEDCGVQDAGFCHGSAGLAHICNRWYQATGDELFRAAARSWFARTLDMRRPDGVAGFAAWSRDRDTEASWRQRTSLLDGITGIGLALLSAIAPVEPRWDRYFLVDLPLRAPVVS